MYLAVETALLWRHIQKQFILNSKSGISLPKLVFMLLELAPSLLKTLSAMLLEQIFDLYRSMYPNQVSWLF
jgi:hypothetical protein